MSTPNDPVSVETIIEPSKGWIRVPWAELWQYRDLFAQFVQRDFSTKFRQTLLGPAWFILQPLMVTAVLTVVFGRLAQLPTDSSPPVLFYLCGMLAWTFFAQTMPTVAGTFTANAHLFGKIYFPRLIVPLSVIAGNQVAFLIQLGTFGVVWTYYRVFTDYSMHALTHPLAAIALVVGAQIQISLLALGVGSILSAATGKYRDLQHILPVLVQLWFYATPVVYPLSMISTEARWRWVATLNPMTAPVEAMKLGLLGQSSWTWPLAAGSAAITLTLLVIGLSAFGRSERSVIDVA